MSNNPNKCNKLSHKPAPIAATSNRQLNDLNEHNDNNNPYEGVITTSGNVWDSKNEIVLKRPEVTICKLRLQFIMTIFIFLIIVCDIIIQIYYDFINYFGMLDNIAVFILNIKLFMICINKKNFYSTKLSIVIAIIIFLGFCLKGLSLSYCMMKEEVNLLLIYGLLIGIRTFGLIWLFPFTCKK